MRCFTSLALAAFFCLGSSSVVFALDETSPQPPVRLVMQGGVSSRNPVEELTVKCLLSEDTHLLASLIEDTLVVYESATGRELWRYGDELVADFFS